MEFVGHVWFSTSSPMLTLDVSRFLPRLKEKCLNSTPGNEEFWSEVQDAGRALSLISDKEAKTNGGSSDVSEAEATKVCAYV